VRLYGLHGCHVAFLSTRMKNFAFIAFLQLAGVLMIATAFGKFASAAGTAKILHADDPVLNISFRTLFCVAGILETVVAAYCFFERDVEFRASLVAWLSTAFVGYHAGLQWIGNKKYCPCLGNLTDAIHLSPERSAMIAKAILGYLLVGSYSILLLFWLRRQKIVSLASD
jgi:hypothetical protein